jgi:DNA polymerase
MTKLNHDFETRSRVDLPKRGLDVYARDPSTKVLMLSWAVDDGKVSLWEPHKGKAPAELRDALLDPHVEKHAWNDNFERTIFEHVLKIKVPGTWRDTMKKARYLSLPGALFECGPIVGIDADKQKMSSGRALINKFCKPRTEKQRTAAKPWEFNDWTTDPEAWDEFGRYCVIDTEAERAIAKKFDAYQMPEREWEIAALDRVINLRGLPIDVPFVMSAITMADRAKLDLKRELRDLCGAVNVTGVAAFQEWAKKLGYPFNDMRKDTVKRALSDFLKEKDANTLLLRKALGVRSDATKTATSKYNALMDRQHEGILRGTFEFYGAQRTGRWAGRGFQPQNLKKPDKNIAKKLDYVTQLVRDDDYDNIDFEFGYPIRVLGSVVRSSIRARPGKILRVADLNAIENRVLGWLAGCKRTLGVFERNLDPYKAFGVHLYQTPYDQITAEQRTGSKPAVLGAGYRLGGGTLMKNKKGDIVKTGLWGYAENMGIVISKEESWQAVAVFREIHPAIVKFWYALEEAALRAVNQRIPTRVGHLVLDYVKGFLRIKLPSGRHLYYLRPHYKSVKFIGPEGPYYKDCLHYEGVDQVTKRWGVLTTHGGKICENCLGSKTRVLTPSGVQFISDIRKGDSVWDGMEWVTTEGVINQGTQPVGEWMGIRVTREHLINDGNSWRPVCEMDANTSRSALKLAHDLDTSSLSPPGLVPTSQRGACATAGRAAQSTHAAFGESKWGSAKIAVGPRRGSGTRSTSVCSPLKNFKTLGAIAIREWFRGVLTCFTTPTTTTVGEASQSTNRGSTTEWYFSDTLNTFAGGTERASIWIAKTTTRAMSREISGSFPARSTPSIGAIHASSNTTVEKCGTAIFGGSSAPSGPTTPLFGTSTKGSTPDGSWRDTGQREEVFDLLDCGPRHQFAVVTDYGLVIVHNCCQAVARDVLAEGLLEAEREGFYTVGHVHDEIITEQDVDDTCHTHELLEQVMCRKAKWAEGLPLAAAGFSSEIYKKD